MRLRTLGGLELKETDFARIKPLILLSYLALEGAKDRRYIAEFFWPEASDGLNSLSRALSQFRKGAPGAVEADEQRVWTPLKADTHDFLDALEAKDFDKAVALYEGPFLQGAYLPNWGVELEEWIYEQREALASRAQDALLNLAEDQAARGRFGEAARQAEQAFELESAPLPEPETLSRYFALLSAGESHLSTKVKEEAEGYGIDLSLGTDEARARLRSSFVGRDRERERLSNLNPGQWAWVRGAAGMGKTSLLKSLSGTYLPGRAGLPYATLEPLLGQSVEEGEDVILRKLAQLEGSWLLDNWDWMDAESQAVLHRLRNLRPNLRVILSSREETPFRVDLELTLGPLSESDLAKYPDLFEKTGGLPALVGAFLRGDAIKDALEVRFATLPEPATRVYLSLAMLETPEPALVRRALELNAREMANALEALVKVGMVAPSGAPRAAQAAKDFLETQPVLSGDLAVRLARQVDGVTAYPLYHQSKLFWEEDDLEQVQAAYTAWANELLRRGFPQRVLDTLSEIDETPEVALVKARGLERAGRFKEALEVLERVPESFDIMAFKGALLWHLGLPDQAKELSERALDGDTEVRAEALNTLGTLARSAGNFEEAASFARRAAALWRSLQHTSRWADALNNLAIAEALKGENSEDTFAEALKIANQHDQLKARTLLNFGWFYERLGKVEDAKHAWREGAELAESIGATDTAAHIHNNLGVMYHRQGQIDKAIESYRLALHSAQRVGEPRLTGIFMANLAEANEDYDAWKEALRLLETSGHPDEADNFRNELAADHPFRAI